MSYGENQVELGAQKCKQKIDMMIIPPQMIIPPTTVYKIVLDKLGIKMRYMYQYTYKMK